MKIGKPFTVPMAALLSVGVIPALLAHVLSSSALLLSPCTTIAGDLDCDCEVDVVDIMEVASRWRCKCGDTCYDSLYNMDSDCHIDIDGQADARAQGPRRTGTGHPNEARGLSLLGPY